MKTLILFMFAALMSLTSAQTFDYTWPTVYTIDVLELPTVPNFLDDYSAPGQIEWNQQVYWELNKLGDLIEETRSYYQERIEFNSFREIQTQNCNNHFGTSQPHWFQTERYKKKILPDF